MDNKTNKADKVADTIKDGAGAAFHGAHNALESTENAAMSAVDQSTEAAKDMNRKKKNKK